jgi:hypothetical protein
MADVPGPRRPRPSRRRLLASASVLLLAAAVAPRIAAAARRRPALEALLEWLPGSYAGPASRLDVVPVYAPLTGPHAFYLRECDPLDESRVRDQQLLAATPAKRGRAVLRVWRFVDPARWRDAHRTTDLFKGLMPGDVTPGPAVEIDWIAGTQRLGARAGGAFPFELDAAALTLRARFERGGSSLP